MVGKDLIMATLFGSGGSGGGIPQEDIDAAFAALAEKGVTVPDGATSADLDDLIESIVTGGGAKIEIQSISPNTDIHTGNKYTLSHSLGVIPNLVIVVWNDTSSLAANLMKFGGVYVIEKTDGGYRMATFCSYLNASTADKQFASVANYTKMSFTNAPSPISDATENDVILCACSHSSIPKMLAGKTYQVLIGKV